MERIMISYPEFLENLEEYKNKYSDSRGSLQYRDKTEIMLIQNLIYRLADIHLYILSLKIQGAGGSFIRLSIPSINRIIDELIKLYPEKYSKWGYIDLDSFNLLYGSDEVILKEVVKFFIGKIFTIKKINEKKSYTVFRIS
jgi:hypothetical protein|nr:MAG TPA: hypothetical protein [Bacteriophage sp.]